MSLASPFDAIRAKIAAHLTPSNALVLKADTGAVRLAAVAHYLHGQATSLRAAHYATVEMAQVRPDMPELQGEATMFLAGAASAEAMGDLLNAILNGDRDAAKAILHSFVNGAVDDGIVSV